MKRLTRQILALSAVFSLLLLCSCTPDIIVEPSPVAVEPDVAVNVQSAIPDIIVESQIYERRYTEELVNIAMENARPWKPWIAKNITSEYIDKGIWLVTVDFKSFKRQYIFDEVDP